jgi:hypothetical protein
MKNQSNARYNDWLQFHTANPHIYELFCQYVDRLISRGFKKYYSTIIWSAMNFDLEIKAGTKGVPKKYRAYYVHYWTEQHPEHPDFFKIKSKVIVPLTS